jgi:hypothetical protein
MNETDLILEGMEQQNAFPPFSARECSQTLTLLPGGSLRRTINGELIRVGGNAHQKFCSIITCKDHMTPAFGNFWAGSLVKVVCIQTLTQMIPALASCVVLERDPLKVRVQDIKGAEILSLRSEGKNVFLPSEFPGGFVTYHPWLVMLVKTYRLETDEWGAIVGWTLELEEK